MPGTTSTALPSFSHDQHHETDAAKRKGGVSIGVELRLLLGGGTAVLRMGGYEFTRHLFDSDNIATLVEANTLLSAILVLVYLIGNILSEFHDSHVTLTAPVDI